MNYLAPKRYGVCQCNPTPLWYWEFNTFQPKVATHTHSLRDGVGGHVQPRETRRLRMFGRVILSPSLSPAVRSTTPALGETLAY